MILDSVKSIRVEDEIARRGGLGLKRYGTELVGPCPRCGGRDRFAVSIRKQVFVCRGCDAAGDVIDLIKHIDRVDFRGAVQMILGGGETAPRNLQAAKIEGTSNKPIGLANQTEIDGQGTAWALRLWNVAVPLSGTPAERYLHRRGLHDLPGDDVLRFHHACTFGKTRVPCLIALYTDLVTDEPKAISRTAIDAAGGKVGRLSLGPVGGCAVKIDADSNVEYGLTISEGLETGLAGRMLGFRPCWSLGSAGAIKTFPILAGISSLTILVDNDAADRHGRQAGQEAAAACSARWTAAGVEVRRILPRTAGADVADLVEQEGGRHHG